MLKKKPEPAGLSVELGPRTYPIYLQAGALPDLGRLIQEAGLGPRGLLVTNPTVAAYYAPIAQASLERAGLQGQIVVIPDGETYKSLAWANYLYEKALAAGLDRRSPVIALGGGVIGDLAGFVAATYLRGVPLIQVPTTLLAQVDSSVGGKVAVNLPQGKNLVGAFYQPTFVLIDPQTLSTLPPRELTAGMAEVIKYGVIWDEAFFLFLEAQIDAALGLDLAVLASIIRRSCAIKGEIVALDEREEGLRALLNFGHTVGHALEAITGYQTYRHGEAVALGMFAAGDIALRLNRWSEAEFGRLKHLLQRAGLPLNVSNVDAEALMVLMEHDKKKLQGTLQWVLPQGMGKADTGQEVPEGLIRAALKRLGDGSGIAPK